MAAVGRRVLLPPSNTLCSDFLEMRYMGAYPGSAAFAFLFQYIERALETNNTESVQRFRRFLSTVKHEATQSLSELTRAMETTRFVASDQFASAVRTATDALLQGLQLTLNSDFHVIECIKKLCANLACRCEIRYLVPSSPTFEMRRMMIEGSSGPLFYVALSTEVFVLYTYMQVDNFYQPKCKCLTLKYHFFEDMAKLAGQRALTASELSVPCRQCQQPISSEDIDLLLEDSHQFTAHGDPKICEGTERGFCCLNASCAKEICTMCAIVLMLTAKGPICNCGLNFLDHVKALTVSHGFNHLARYVDVAAKPMKFEYDAKQIELNARLSGTVKFEPNAKPIELNARLSGTVAQETSKATTIQTTIMSTISDGVNAFKQGVMSLTLPVKERQPVRSQGPHLCRICQKRITHSMCSRGCTCLHCGYSAAYSKDTLLLKCRMCNSECPEHFNQKKACLTCGSVAKLKELAYFCSRCKLVVCAICFRSSKGQIKVCLEGVPHILEPSKLQAVSKPAEPSLFQSLWP